MVHLAGVRRCVDQLGQHPPGVRHAAPYHSENKKTAPQRGLRSPLPDSNRRPLPYHGSPAASPEAPRRAKVPAYAQESGSGIRPHSSAGFGTLRYRVGTLTVAAGAGPRARRRLPAGRPERPSRARTFRHGSHAVIALRPLAPAPWSGARRRGGDVAVTGPDLQPLVFEVELARERAHDTSAIAPSSRRRTSSRRWVSSRARTVR
jgi:hypothetical protein